MRPAEGARRGPCALTVAGSDSGGNAGVQADLRAFHAYGVHGCTAFTSLTAQNPFGVRAIHPVPPAFIAAQIDAVFAAYAVGAVKTGMLGTAAAADAVARALEKNRPAGVPLVVDPVMVATSGARLIDDDAVAVLRERLLPAATLVTPNVPEAEALLGAAVTGERAMRAAAEELARRFGCAVLVKGGHAVGARAVDVLCDGRRCRAFARPAVENPVSTHGTGCTLAAACAAGLACGLPLARAVARAKNYVYEAIRLSYHIGDNCGVLGMPRGRKVPEWRQSR